MFEVAMLAFAHGLSGLHTACSPCKRRLSGVAACIRCTSQEGHPVAEKVGSNAGPGSQREVGVAWNSSGNAWAAPQWNPIFGGQEDLPDWCGECTQQRPASAGQMEIALRVTPEAHERMA